MQNVPNPKFHMWHVRLADETSNKEFVVDKYEFTYDRQPDSLGMSEGNDVDLNFRKVFLPEEGHLLVSRDFKGQELRILANLSGEPSWIKTFLEGGDIHKQTAISIFGEENYKSELRSVAKTINFGLVYGMEYQSLATKLGIPEKEAKAHISKFFEAHKGIDNYLKSQATYGAQHKEIKNLYGRKRRLHRDYDVVRGFLNSGRRKAYNFPIQSMGAEIMKLGLLKLYYNILTKEEYKDKVYFMSMIHDEINLSVDKSVLNEVCFKLGQEMTHHIPGMPVPIITDLAIGTSMGLIWSFNQDPETLELTPVIIPYND